MKPLRRSRRRPRPTQGCSCSKEEEEMLSYIIFLLLLTELIPRGLQSSKKFGFEEFDILVYKAG
jgi:hypothetical protein